MEDQIIDVESTEVVEEEIVLTPEISLNEDKIKSPAEIRRDLEQLKQLNKQLKKIKRYMKSPIHAVRQMDAKTQSNSWYIISNLWLLFWRGNPIGDGTCLENSWGVKALGGSTPPPSVVHNYIMDEQFYKELCERIQHSIQISVKHGHNEYALGLKKSIMIVNELKHKYQAETK